MNQKIKKNDQTKSNRREWKHKFILGGRYDQHCLKIKQNTFTLVIHTIVEFDCLVSLSLSLSLSLLIFNDENIIRMPHGNSFTFFFAVCLFVRILLLVYLYILYILCIYDDDNFVANKGIFFSFFLLLMIILQVIMPLRY